MRCLENDTEGLLNTEFRRMARNTIDYWMLPDSKNLTESELIQAIEGTENRQRSTLQIYIHIPFCAQKCSFCAFSGGNSLKFEMSKLYVRHVIKQLGKILERVPIYGQARIRSVHIGGGSPDLVGSQIGQILEYVHSLSGVDEQTELSVECAPATVKKYFLDECIKHNVTKLSFGVQSFSPDIRRNVRLPASTKKVEEICNHVAGQIPIINADLITGLPGQNFSIVSDDLHYAIEHEVINAVSTYLLTPGVAPSLIADVKSKFAPKLPTHTQQAHFRLHSYSCLTKAGWQRKGTNTYMDPSSIAPGTLDFIPGNECIGAAHYDSYLIAAGAQAIGSAPGVRFENTVNIDNWMSEIQAGGLGFNLKKSGLHHQRDMSLWTFPLFYRGLEKWRYNEMLEGDILSERQTATLWRFVEQGLVYETKDSFQLSILGEVFMGHLVHDLKTETGQSVLDEFIDEGYAIADAINSGLISQVNSANDRQTVMNKISNES